MNIIFYWKKTYFEDEYPLKDFTLYTKYPPNSSVLPGEIMWVITKYKDKYVLLGKFVIQQTKRETNPKHGDFCLVSDSNKSVYYELNNVNQNKFKSVLQKMKQWNNDEIGEYFHGEKHIHELTDSQHQKIEGFSRLLPQVK